MIYFLSMPGCARSRRIKRWMKDNEIESTTLPLMDLLMLDEFASILADSRQILESFMDVSLLPACFFSLPKEKRVQLIQNSPSAFYRPVILVNENALKNDEKTTLLCDYLNREPLVPCPASCKIIPVCQDLRAENKAGLVIFSNEGLEKIINCAKERAYSHIA